MTLFFPDLNVWLALADVGNSHHAAAWAWINNLAPDDRLIFSRYTQLGLLRLLTNTAVMGDQTLTIRQAWAVYDRWLEDPRVEFCPDPRNVEDESPAYRSRTASILACKVSKARPGALRRLPINLSHRRIGEGK